jgi:glutamine amidotransferase
MRDAAGKVAIVDYELGNLFSVQHACAHVGLDALVTSSRREIAQADAVILPGVGAFADAMATLERRDLVGVLKDVAGAGRPFLGICLGMQLLMSESTEFGRSPGLGLIAGGVHGIADVLAAPRPKIPHVGWNRMYVAAPAADAWTDTLLNGIPNGVYMHFVHSYFVRPEDASLTVAVTEYGGLRFCSALRSHNIFACQAHPERSGPFGLAVYRNLATVLNVTRHEHA